MKRIIALCCAALLLWTGAAQAAEWREGLTAAKPYPTLPQVDLAGELGYMMFYPNKGMSPDTFCETLYVYLPREDVMAGEGVLQLNTVEDGSVLRIAMNDKEVIRQRAMSEEELELWMWGSGSCFEIQLPQALDFGRSYYVTMSQGCIVTQDGISSPAMNDREAWRFDLAGEYGVGGLARHRLPTDGQDGIEISFHLELGGDAKSAVLYSRDASVDFPISYFSESSQVKGVAAGDSPAWGVMFFDAQGSKLDQLEF